MTCEVQVEALEKLQEEMCITHGLKYLTIFLWSSLNFLSAFQNLATSYGLEALLRKIPKVEMHEFS